MAVGSRPLLHQPRSQRSQRLGSVQEQCASQAGTVPDGTASHAFEQYSDSMRRNPTITRDTETDARLELIKHLSQQVADVPTNSRQHQRLRAAIRVEAGAYRKSLDLEQAMAMHDPKPQRAVGQGSLITRRTVGV
jgi:hypothetical protein